MLVFRDPGALQRHDRRIEVLDECRWREALLQRGCVNEWLERRAWLSLRLRGAIERALLEVAAANHRAHFAGVRVHRDKRGLQGVGASRLLRALTLLNLG